MEVNTGYIGGSMSNVSFCFSLFMEPLFFQNVKQNENEDDQAAV
jgi:hypothetical protein